MVIDMKIDVEAFEMASKEGKEARQIFAEKLKALEPGSRFELGDTEYTLTGKFATGIEGDKHKIINNETQEEFVLKVYYHGIRGYKNIMGDLFIKEKAHQ